MTGFFVNLRGQLGFLMNAGGKGEPPQKLFCVNTLPKQPNAQYIWMDDRTWDDDLYWID